MSDKKFTTEELKTVNELQSSYVSLQNAIGQISIGRIRLEQQIDQYDKAEDEIRAKFVDTQQKERDFMDSINKKYGDGNLDINTGIFTPKITETVEKAPETK